jgi:predicted secreted protein
MAKGLANNYRVWLENATAGTYNLIKGQTGASISRSAGSVDLTTKDDGGYGSSAPGTRALTISMSLIPNLPDALGYTRLETLSNSATPAPFKIQVRKGGDAGGTTDVVFEGSVYGNIDTTDFALNAGVTTTHTFTGAGAPTTDVFQV